MKRTRTGVLLSVTLLLGCGSSGDKTGEATTEPGETPPATAEAAASVYLESRSERGNVVVDVVARGVPVVHGAAFRLRWDASKLSFVGARGSGAWSSRSLLLAKEGAPGELVVAWTEKGQSRGIDARADTRLGSITFAPKASGRVSLAFRSDRSMLVDATGAPVATEWRGADVVAP